MFWRRPAFVAHDLPKQLVADGRAYVEQRNRDAEQIWGIGEGDRWTADLAAGTLSFHIGDRVITGPAHVLGSYSSETNSWLWAWANPSLPEQVTLEAARAGEIGRRAKVGAFTQEKMTVGDASVGDDLAAVAAMLAELNGVYRAPINVGYIWFGLQTFSE